MIRDRIHWSTQSEMEFLDGVGKGNWKKSDGRDPDLRFKCLMGYRDSILKRFDWGEVNRDEIVKHLNRILAGYGIEALVIKTDTERKEENDRMPSMQTPV